MKRTAKRTGRTPKPLEQRFIPLPNVQPPELVARVREFAERSHTTSSQIVRDALRAYLPILEAQCPSEPTETSKK